MFVDWTPIHERSSVAAAACLLGIVRASDDVLDLTTTFVVVIVSHSTIREHLRSRFSDSLSAQLLAAGLELVVVVDNDTVACVALKSICSTL